MASSAPAAAKMVVGTLEVAGTTQMAALAAFFVSPTGLTLDDETHPIPLDARGRFEIADMADGDHSLYVLFPLGRETEIPFRMFEGRGLNLGTVTIREGFGWVDADGDGVNDWSGYRYDMGYRMGPGFQGGGMGGAIDWPMQGGGMMRWDSFPEIIA